MHPPQGWIPLHVIGAFNRVRMLTPDPMVIVSAMQVRLAPFDRPFDRPLAALLLALSAGPCLAKPRGAAGAAGRWAGRGGRPPLCRRLHASTARLHTPAAAG